MSNPRSPRPGEAHPPHLVDMRTPLTGPEAVAKVSADAVASKVAIMSAGTAGSGPGGHAHVSAVDAAGLPWVFIQHSTSPPGFGEDRNLDGRPDRPPDLGT